MPSRKLNHEGLVRLALAIAISAGLAAAQSSTAEISGQVTDETGAAIAGAQVTIRSADTGESREFQTEEAGNYLFTQLAPGTYQLAIEKGGFRRMVRDGIILQVGQRARVDTKLPVGAVTESVEVKGEAPLLDSDDAALGQVIENRKVLELPLNGRNINSLAALATGVIPGSGFGGGIPYGRAALIQAATANLTINGGMSAQNDVLVDGVPLSLCCQNQIAFLPSVDTTEEFRVRANLYDAQYGRTSGGLVTFATKSGTNEYHGSAYEFLRNQKFDANNFFSNRTGLGKTHFVYNQFGARAGGPIIHNKTFFFVNYEGVRNRKGALQPGTVPTDAERGGTFTQAIYDPLTVVTLRLPFRGEFFNIFNTPRFGAPAGGFGNTNFGVVSAQDNDPRDIQFALRLIF